MDKTYLEVRRDGVPLAGGPKSTMPDAKERNMQMPRKAKKADLYRQELRSGMSCREIAEKYGITVQAVYAACGSVQGVRFRRYEEKDCIWVGLRDWLNDHKVSRRSLLRQMGLEYSNCNLERLNQNLKGRNDLRMSFIRKMMSITGMTYEELFREEKK